MKYNKIPTILVKRRIRELPVGSLVDIDDIVTMGGGGWLHSYQVEEDGSDGRRLLILNKL